MKTLPITTGQYSSAEVARVTGLDQGLLKLWLNRGLLHPDRVEVLAKRSRPHYSVVDVFKVKLMQVLIDCLSVPPTPGTIGADRSEKQPPKNRRSVSISLQLEISNALANEGWMWAQARSIEAGKPLPIFAAMTRLGDDWDFHLHVGDDPFKPSFGKDRPYIIVPVGAIFADVYRACRKLTVGEGTANKEKARRARS
jgi:hypothetical protein